MHMADVQGHVEVAQLLARSRADVNGPDSEDRRPIHVAANFGHVSVLDTLIKDRADPKATDQDGWQPMTWAAMPGHMEVVESLASHRASLAPLNKVSIQQRGHAAVSALLQRKVNVSFVNLLVE